MASADDWDDNAEAQRAAAVVASRFSENREGFSDLLSSFEDEAAAARGFYLLSCFLVQMMAVDQSVDPAAIARFASTTFAARGEGLI